MSFKSLVWHARKQPVAAPRTNWYTLTGAQAALSNDVLRVGDHVTQHANLRETHTCARRVRLWCIIPITGLCKGSAQGQRARLPNHTHRFQLVFGLRVRLGPHQRSLRPPWQHLPRPPLPRSTCTKRAPRSRIPCPLLPSPSEPLPPSPPPLCSPNPSRPPRALSHTASSRSGVPPWLTSDAT